MKLIVGLGNPGKEYENTRHNIGFEIVDNFLSEVSWQEKFDGDMTSININNEKILFFKPLTYMNNSGIAVAKIVSYFDIDLNNILVIHDDLDLEFGNYKIKYDSSSGGHNGIKSIISHLNSQKFWQFKIGISNPKENIRDYVTGKFNKSEKTFLDSNKDIYNEIVNSFINDGGYRTMAIYNNKRK